MNIFDYNIDIDIEISVKQVILIVFLIFIVVLICFIVFSYLVIKLLQKGIDDNNVFFYQYNKKSQKILNEYGNCLIKKVYLVRQPFTKFITFCLNFFTFYRYNALIEKYHEYYPYHTLVILEIQQNNKNLSKSNSKTKLLMIEKNNCINISENFLICKTQETLNFNIKNKGITLNKLLEDTQTRIGPKKFFNWNIYENNCQEFTKELLVTMEKMNPKIKEYIFRDKIIKIYNPSEFTLHTINCICAIYNIFEKYIFDSELFN